MNQEDIEKINKKFVCKIVKNLIKELNDPQNEDSNETNTDWTSNSTTYKSSELYKALFDDEADADTKQDILTNIAYIIDSCILENYSVDRTALPILFDEIYHNIIEVYFARYYRINLTMYDRRLLGGIILTILNKLDRTLVRRKFKFDGIYLDNEWLDSNPLRGIIKDYITFDDVHYDTDSTEIEKSVANIIESIMNEMNYLALVFTNLYHNKVLFTDKYELQSSYIICTNPLSFDYDKKLNYLINMLINYRNEYGTYTKTKCQYGLDEKE